MDNIDMQRIGNAISRIFSVCSEEELTTEEQYVVFESCKKAVIELAAQGRFLQAIEKQILKDQ